MPQSPACPLLITSDTGVQEAVLTVAEEAHVEIAVASDVGAAASRWGSAPLVLLDAAHVEDAARLLPRPQPALVIVSREIDDAAVWRQIVAIGAEQVVELPQGAPWLVERLGRRLTDVPKADVIVVAGAVGGAGCSTLAAALARAALHSNESADGRAVLVDLDPLGGGIDLLVAAEDVAGARWGELAGIAGPVDDRSLLEALPSVEGLPLLSWSPNSDLEPTPVAVAHVLDALVGRRGIVVVDGGRLCDSRTAVAVLRCALLVIVVPLRVRAVAAARSLLRRLPVHVTPALVVREPAPGGLRADDVSAALGLPVCGVLPDDRRRAGNEEAGAAPPTSSSWRSVTSNVLSARSDVAA
jgi:secretion/DNA translocation related CpaE-like protein